MALLTDDCDIQDVRFWMEWGGNGDPYINLMATAKREISKGDLCRLSMRFAMSGGNTNKSIRVRNAIVEMYRAMEEMNWNNHPKDDKTPKP